MTKFNLGYYHGYNGYLASKSYCHDAEYLNGYTAGMKAEDDAIFRSLKSPAPAFFTEIGQ